MEGWHQKTKDIIVPGNLRMMKTALKADFHSAIFEIPVCPTHEDHMMPKEKNVQCVGGTL